MKYIPVILLLIMANSVIAHNIPLAEAPTQVDITLTSTWRSHSLVDDYEYWQIPGTQMGGHAWPVREGITLDEMTLGVAHRLDDNVFAVVKFGSHAADSDHQGVELEHAYLGFVCCEAAGPWVAEVGKMSARFSPYVGEHASDRLFSEASLTQDVLFGRYFHDEGLRIWWHETAGFSAGAEIWRGAAYPATDSEHGGAWDIFARYRFQHQNVTLEAGGWYYSAAAEARADHRYGGGHQHTPVAPPGQTATQFPDTRYSGDTVIRGLHGRVQYAFSASVKAGVESELAAAELDGIVHDAIGRQATLNGDQYSLWVQPYLSWNQHTWALRAERLINDHALTGAAAPQLGTDSGLANPDDITPQRISALWRWQWRKDVALRAEIIHDETLAEVQNRWAVGFIWKYNLMPSARQHAH